MEAGSKTHTAQNCSAEPFLRQPVHQLVGQGKEGFCSLLDIFVLPDIIIAYKLLLFY